MYYINYFFKKKSCIILTGTHHPGFCGNKLYYGCVDSVMRILSVINLMSTDSGGQLSVGWTELYFLVNFLAFHYPQESTPSEY